MKSPPIQYTDDEAHRMVEEFITTNQNKEVKPDKEEKKSKAKS
jgi:hypothetical protein